MNKKEQLSALRKAMELTGRVSELKAVLNDVTSKAEIKQPQPPVHEKVKAQYPQIKSNVKFSWAIALVPIAVIWFLSAFLPIIGALMLLVSPAWIAVYYFVIYKKQKEADVEKTLSSEQYRKQCADIDAETERKQKELDEKYQAAIKEYNEVILPNYQRNLEALKKQHEEEIKKAQQELNAAKQELAEHYENTQIVPGKYRNYEALMYIHTALSMSVSSVGEAIALYEEDCDRRANVSYDNVSFSGGSTGEGHGALSSWVNQSIEKSNIKMNAGKVGKRDLIGQAGCAKNHGGDCSDCNIRRGCSRYYF